MAPHHKVVSTLPHGEREIPSECRYMNQCANVPNGQRHQSIFIIVKHTSSFFIAC